ncbi:S46 family peptidase [Zavarzinella formosa]|uniref:S46 family peptidase n=1 Tax=Zavarzinella formosa TaxID=360055 RepID=UPI0002E23C1C|nr:S46 family peptidase [Zavarzinella formosa]
MMIRRIMAGLCLAIVGACMESSHLYGDEGMWLYTNAPKEYLKKKYGFEPTDAWLDHLRLGSVRFNSGGSGSFVSADGLVMTNHHVGADDLQKLSDEKNDYLKTGFFAKTLADEKPCKGLELNVLLKIEDVTAKVQGAVKEGMTPGEAADARRKAVGEIEKSVADEKKNIRADVVTLYAGGAYHLYTYKKHTDIRLVFAPEQQIAFYGGDPDNFEFPRYDLDMCFFRVYEDGKPLKVEHYLKWSPAGSQKDELVFVSGHPGRTNRQNTVAELEYLRDYQYPLQLQRLNRLEVLYSAWGGRSEENHRRVKDDLFGVQNSRKARIGGLGGLLDPKIMARKVADEKRLREFVGKQGSTEAVKAFDTIAECEKLRLKIARDVNILEGGAGFNSALFGIARTLLRAGDELPKPSGERLREFGDARLGSLKFQLLSDEEIYPDLELIKLADSLTYLAGAYGANDSLVEKILAGKSPRERAFELVSGTKVADPAVRKKLFDGGAKAVAEAKDPMIELARLIDADARKFRKQFENQIEEPKRQAAGAIAKARFALDGTNSYPDATFTLRLAFGTVKGYTEDGKTIEPFTMFDGLYARSKEHKNQSPFDLPALWETRKDKLNLKTPFNFLCTADIIGGNSGSPVVNKNGEVVGLIFDGNIQSLVLDFIFEDQQARAVSVDSRAIIEALRSVYQADSVAEELTSGKRPVK